MANNDSQLTAIEKAIRDQSADLLGYANRGAGPVRHLTARIIRPANTTQYSADDAFTGGQAAPTKFIDSFGAKPDPGIVGVNSGFIITDAIVAANGSTVYNGEIWLFDNVFSAQTDNSAFTITDVDVTSVIGVIPFSTSQLTSNNSISYVTDINIRIWCAPSDVRFAVKITNTPTPVSTETLDIKIKYQPLRAL